MIDRAATMWHFGRCGSTVLCRMLSKHPEVSWHGEYYLNIFQRWWKRAGRTEVIGELKEDEDPRDLLRTKMETHDEGWFFFEMKTWHPRLLRMTIPEFVGMSEELGVDRHVVLERENRLRIVVSILVAHQRGHYHNKGDGPSGLTQVHVPVEEDIHADFEQKPLIEFLRGYDEQLATLQESIQDKPSLHITYEDDIREDPSVGYRKVCEFFDLEPQEVSPDLSRTNPHSLSDIISNFDEVAHKLSGTEFEWMLEG